MPEIPRRLITYCSNVHPVTGWSDTFRALAHHVPEVKASLSPEGAFPIGLRLSAAAALALTSAEDIRFRSWLGDNDCFVATINGFPYGDFHGQSVKEQVYLPDWRSLERVAYTCQLADLLAGWLPKGIVGSISTVPIGFKGMVGPADIDLCKRHLGRVLDHLARIRDKTGGEIVLALEPEPGCVLETTEEVCRFFAEMDPSIPGADLLGLCFDCCHQAVEFEDPAVSLNRLAEAGIRIAKVQISSALRFHPPSDAALERFDEPRYLHQVAVRTKTGDLLRFDDLPLARARHPLHEEDEWRCHFHVPIFIDRFDGGKTTRTFLEEIVPLLPEDVLLEVETYTWDVLPADLRLPSLTSSIIRELDWLKGQIDAAHRRP